MISLAMTKTSPARVQRASDDGFTQVPNSVIRDPHLSSGALRVYVYLTSYDYDNDARVRPAVSTVAKECGYSRRTIQDLLTELEDEGLVTREPQPGRANVYVLHKRVSSRSSTRSGLDPRKIASNRSSASLGTVPELGVRNGTTSTPLLRRAKSGARVRPVSPVRSTARVPQSSDVEAQGRGKPVARVPMKPRSKGRAVSRIRPVKTAAHGKDIYKNTSREKRTARRSARVRSPKNDSDVSIHSSVDDDHNPEDYFIGLLDRSNLYSKFSAKDLLMAHNAEMDQICEWLDKHQYWDVQRLARVHKAAQLWSKRVRFVPARRYQSYWRKFVGSKEYRMMVGQGR